MTFDSASFLVQVGALLVVLGALHKPFGIYLARVFEGKTTSRPERLFYRIAGIDAGTEQTWSVYLRSVLAFSAVSILVVFGLQRLQGVLPGSGSLPGVDSWVAMNTAISFVTNTNWQTYVPETTVGIFVQMSLLAVQNFLSAAVGIVVVVALIRGIARTRTQRLGNFWVDLARTIFRVLLPISEDQVPAEAVAASGSGLDPDISPAYARLQTPRVAAAQHLCADNVMSLVNKHTTAGLTAFLGQPSVNVTALNLDLAAAAQSK